MTTTELPQDPFLPRSALVPAARTVVRSELPLTAVARSTPDPLPTCRPGQPGVLVVPELTFEAARTVLSRGDLVGVIAESPQFPDHAKKMLSEGRKVFVQCAGARELLPDGSLCQIDNDGLINLDALDVNLSAICSHITPEVQALYERWGVDTIGYFRFKFSLFQLFAEHPAAHSDTQAITDHLVDELHGLYGLGYRTIRVVLSDPSSYELAELGISVEHHEPNPDLGLRGPRDLDRWEPELEAVAQFLDDHPDVALTVSAPFISSVQEFQAVANSVRSSRVGTRAGLGLTLEVPALAYSLEQLVAVERPAFVAIGTSDLFALFNAVDRNHAALSVDPFSDANTLLVQHISKLLTSLGVPFFVCGEVRRDPARIAALVADGCREFIVGASHGELARVCRAVATGRS